LQKMSSADKKFILVTGGTGLVGSAIRRAVEMEGEKANETFMFLSSKDLDLT
jgi:GDP-L-fucose synthase